MQAAEGHAGHWFQFEESSSKARGGDESSQGTCQSLVPGQRKLEKVVKFERENLKAVSSINK